MTLSVRETVIVRWLYHRTMATPSPILCDTLCLSFARTRQTNNPTIKHERRGFLFKCGCLIFYSVAAKHLLFTRHFLIAVHNTIENCIFIKRDFSLAVRLIETEFLARLNPNHHVNELWLALLCPYAYINSSN